MTGWREGEKVNSLTINKFAVVLLETRLAKAMPSASAATFPPGDVRAPSTRRVLFALSQEEWQLFFSGGFGLPGMEVFRFPEGTASLREALSAHRPDVLVTSWSTPAVEESWLRELPDLRYICHTSGSVRHVVPRRFLEAGGLVTNWGTLASQAVAEHALLLILAGLRRMGEWQDVISGKRRWQPSPIFTRTLHGKRVGIHGFGNVARALVALLQPFGVSVSAFTKGVPEEHYQRQNVRISKNLEELFEGSDVLVECEALTPETHGLVTREILHKLPGGALFVNVGRGAVVDEKALSDLSRSGHLRLALDVYASDPIAPDSPLHDAEGAILSPHIAGPTSDQFARCGERVEKNLAAFASGRPLEAVVTLEMYDRAT